MMVKYKKPTTNHTRTGRNRCLLTVLPAWPQHNSRPS